MRRSLLLACAAAIVLVVADPAVAQRPVMLSIASGNTGGVYYPLAGGLAALLTKHVPGWQVTAEVTGGSVDNLRLVGAGRADLAFVMADAAWDAYTGRDKFQGKPQPVRTLMVLYPNRMHVVTVDGTGITSMEQLKGKRVSVGAPGSATELMGSRVLAALGLGDGVRRERLGINESVNAMKDRKIDAFLWAGGLPTAGVMDLAATPGMRVRLLDHGQAVDAMNRAHGPLYVKSRIPPRTYSGQDKEVSIAIVWNLLIASASMSDEMAYRIVKMLDERKPEMVAVHKEAEGFAVANQAAGGSPIPFHPGAARYYAERGIKVK
jgi:TRAP transporter TAXI family solute receptor